MPDITITKVNETWLKVKCKEVYQELDIQDRFSFQVANAQFDPRVKRGVWDGIKKLYNRRDKKMYTGLLYELLKFCDKKSWTVNIDPSLDPNGGDMLSTEDLENLVKNLICPHSNGEPIEPFDYQLDAVQYMLNMDRSVVLAATSSGKSLIIYLAVRLYQLMDELNDKNIFITVPSISLVEQLYADFQDYSTFEGSEWHVSQYCQKVSGKYDKFINKQIVITTWQSMAKLPYDIYENIGAIFIDETHTAQASTLSKLIESATTCPIRHGLTGTLDGCEANELVIQGLLGPAKRIVTAKEIIDKGRASNIQVTMAMLEHNDENRKTLYNDVQASPTNGRYNIEVDFLNSLESRRQLLEGMIGSLHGNTLVLFDRVESYGKELYETYKENHPDNTFLIIGDVDSDEREQIRLGMEDHDNAVIFASYGTMSTGISIKKLHNLVLASSSKSKIRVLQSIGRLMRLHSSKEDAQIIDIVDNLTWNDKKNYTLKHAETRLEYYSQEQFDIDFIKLNI